MTAGVGNSVGGSPPALQKPGPKNCQLLAPRVTRPKGPLGVPGDTRRAPVRPSGSHRDPPTSGKSTSTAPLIGGRLATSLPGGRAEPVSKPTKATRSKWVQQYPIPHTTDPQGVMRKLLGPGGAHVKGIAERHGCKLRIRGLGSGHLEGRERREAQIPLHLCLSAPSRAAFDGAATEVRRLVNRATGTNSKVGLSVTPLLRVAVVNEGKLSDTSSFSLASWAKENRVEVCLVSEGALPGKSLTTEGGYVWAAPLQQRKGGAGFLFSEEAAALESKVKIRD